MTDQTKPTSAVLDQLHNGTLILGGPNRDDDSLRSLAARCTDLSVKATLIRHAADVEAALAKTNGSAT